MRTKALRLLLERVAQARKDPTYFWDIAHGLKLGRACNLAPRHTSPAFHRPEYQRSASCTSPAWASSAPGRPTLRRQRAYARWDRF